MNPSIITILEALEDRDVPVSLWETKLTNALDTHEEMRQFISDLHHMMFTTKDFHDEHAPFYHLFLSIAYHAQDKYKNAEETLNNSILGFHSQGLRLNEVLAEWVFGIIHSENDYSFLAEQACEKASSILKSLIEECKVKGRHNRAGEYANYLKQIEALHEEVVKPKQPQPIKDIKPLLNEKQQLGIKISQSEISRSKEGKRTISNENLQTKDINESRGVKHIIIPVNIEALRDRNPTLHLLDDEGFGILQSYEEKIGHSNGNSASNPQGLLKQFTVPSFPIYGPVAAGNNGAPNLGSSDLEMAEAINNNTYINFEGRKFEVMFINDKQIIVPPGKRHGWLKVVGQSMNNSSPIPINNGDYVLFSENRDVKSCEDKIVVAVLPDIYNQLPQLVIKRLLRNNISKSEHPEYALHSESTLDKDPQTGINYKQDIKIINDDQLAGEVIAIAIHP